ncbi:MAG TPA: toll/interleukin-1 receptor domain-containing protein [Thermoanaerobaculia bacterium]|nr:toll/interleukin-1 receptor domain-containing protein [Thermoanaerobaculia bacterium]
MQSALPSPGEPRYQAFISYSHSDRQWGERLHRWLESYRIPERLVGTMGKHGARVPSSSDLGQEIKTALAGSRTLIVVCSPRSARSEWVEEEIFQFKRLGGEERTFGLIVEGEPFASEDSEAQGSR